MKTTFFVLYTYRGDLNREKTVSTLLVLNKFEQTKLVFWLEMTLVICEWCLLWWYCLLSFDEFGSCLFGLKAPKGIGELRLFRILLRPVLWKLQIFCTCFLCNLLPLHDRIFYVIGRAVCFVSLGFLGRVFSLLSSPQQFLSYIYTILGVASHW